MKTLLQTIILAFIVSVSYVSAQTVAVETFDYAAGNAKDIGTVGNGWGGAWTLGTAAVSDSIKIVAGSIGFTGLKLQEINWKSDLLLLPEVQFQEH